MDTVKKQIASWEIKYGQIAITGKEYLSAKSLFDKYFGRTFEIQTFLGNFKNRHFIHESTRNSLRLACAHFFSKLSEGQIIYLRPINENSIQIIEKEPSSKKIIEKKDIEVKKDLPIDDILKLIYAVTNENKTLREENEMLLKYKDRIEKYQKLEYIFEDEKFMEDWLERNIHKAISNLEIIDRQPTNIWSEGFMRDRPDFFCIDKTTREFVVVENKVRGRFRRVDTQYLKYKAWVKRNLTSINEKYNGSNIKATDNFKFVIITDTTDERLEAICEDNRITLVQIDGGVIFEEIIPYYFE